MKDIQKEVNDFAIKYNLGGSIETRFIDLSSEVGELGFCLKKCFKKI